jgi:cysteinyl-tRNA synthetase
MSIHIYNSLTRTKEEFIPEKPPHVNIYTCGVTVYDESHIGHARSLYIFDVIRRYLKYRGFKVKFVRNITDIDDKIINRARELKIDWKELVRTYIARYQEDARGLGIEKGDYEPRATENIPDMVRYIGVLIDKGYAYVTATGVYFNVRKFREYGKLSGQGIGQMLTGVRKEPDETKEDPLDFALWKLSKEGEPFWESPWGNGRPGWHIECSVMSRKFLKADTLDIHAGGRDLIFPHHENEIAQAEALTDKPFAKYWIHHGLLTINGQKMSKSLGNFITIHNFIDDENSRNGNGANILKLFFLSAHYSHPIDYNGKKIQDTRQALESILILKDKMEKKIAESPDRNSVTQQFKEIENIKNEFIKVMDDDFNTPEGLACIFNLVNAANKNIDDLGFIFQAKTLLFELTNIFGLELKSLNATVPVESLKLDARIVSPDVLTEQNIEILVRQRNNARKTGNFQEADKIRKGLEDKGIILEDTKDGTTTWRRKL